MALFGKNVGIEQIRPEAIRPAPIGSSQFSGAPRYSGVGGNATRLADSLASLNSSLARFGSISKAASEPTREEITDEENLWYGMTPEEREARLKSPEFLSLDKTVRDAAWAVAGSARATEWQQEMQAVFSDKDYDPKADKAADLYARRQQEMQAFENNPAGAAAFWKASDSYYNRFVSGVQTEIADDALQARDDAVFSHVTGRVNDSMLDGITADTNAEFIVKEMEALKDYIKMDTGSRNAVFMKIIGHFADIGQPALVSSLLNAKRGEAGPIGDTAEWAAKGVDMVNLATGVKIAADKESGQDFYIRAEQAVNDGSFTEAFINKMSPEDQNRVTPSQRARWLVESQNNRARIIKARKKAQLEHEYIIHQNNWEGAEIAKAVKIGQRGGLGDFTSIGPAEGWVRGPDGKPRKVTMTAKQIQDGAIAETLKDIENTAKKQVVRGVMTTDEAAAFVLNEKLDFSARNNLVLPEWENKFQAVANAAATGVVNDEIPPQDLLDAGNEFAEIEAKNSQVAQSILKGSPESRRWLEVYSNAKNILKATDQVAARQATRALGMSEGAIKAAGQRAKKAVDESLSRLADGGWFDRDKLPAFEINDEDRDRFARTMTQLMVVSNLPAAAAQKKAIELFEEGSIVVNGHLLDKTDKGFPTDGQELLEGYLDEWVTTPDSRTPDQTHGELEGIESGSDLYLVQVGVGQWLITHQDSGDYVNNDHMVTTAHLNALRKKRADQAAVTEAAWADYKAEHGKTKAVVFWGLGGFDPSESGITPSLAKAINADASLKRRVGSFVDNAADRLGYTKGKADGKEVYVDREGQTFIPLITLTNNPEAEFDLDWAEGKSLPLQRTPGGDFRGNVPIAPDFRGRVRRSEEELRGPGTPSSLSRQRVISPD